MYLAQFKKPKNIRRLVASVGRRWSGAGMWMYLSSNSVSLSPSDCKNINIVFDHRGLQSECFEVIRSDTQATDGNQTLITPVT